MRQMSTVAHSAQIRFEAYNKNKAKWFREKRPEISCSFPK